MSLFSRERPAKRGTPFDWLIVGLGNPGKEYAHSRHNVGADAVSLLADRLGTPLRAGRDRSLVAEVRIDAHRCVLAVPTTFMNLSGEAASALVRRYGINEPGQVLVVHDELDIVPGTIRVKCGGGDNGHNGLKSIRGALGTGEWFRVRLGIGRPEGQHDAADFVLKPFAQRVDADLLAARGADAVESLVSLGLDHTQNAFNS